MKLSSIAPQIAAIFQDSPPQTPTEKHVAFSVAMHYIRSLQRGYELPTVLFRDLPEGSQKALKQIKSVEAALYSYLTASTFTEADAQTVAQALHTLSSLP